MERILERFNSNLSKFRETSSMHDFYGNGEVSFETFDFYSIFSIEMNRIFVPDVPIFLPYITKFTTKITKSMKFRSRNIEIPFHSKFFFLFLRRIFANLRSVLIRGNRLPVKVISSNDGKTDSSSN